LRELAIANAKRRTLAQEIRFEYRDDSTTFFLWWKVIFLVPLWAIPILIAVGAFLGVFPAHISYLAGFTYFLAMFSGIAYFLHDFRKQFIRISSDSIWVGLMRYDLPELEYVYCDKVQNDGQPALLRLCFRKSKALYLKLNRFKKPELASFLQTLETKCPQAKISNLVRETIQPITQTEQDELSIRISPHLFLEQMRSGFASTQRFWSENSFLFVFVLCSPVWSLIVYVLIFVPSEARNTNYGICEFSSMLGMMIAQSLYTLTNTGVSALCALSKETIVGLAAATILSAVALKYAKTFLSTDCLQLDDKGILLKKEFSGIEYSSTVRLLWEDAKIVKFESNVLQLSGLHDSQTISVDLSTLNSEKKSQLFSYLSKHLKEAQMDAGTQEAMMPKQNLSYTELWLQSLTQSPSPQHLLPLQEGRKLNEDVYTVHSAIGAGGQGTAYLCTKNAGKANAEKVVLKEIIFPVHVDSSVRKQNLERFENEANLLKNLDHQNIVRLTDYFVEDHRGYLVLEYIEGQDLRSMALDKLFDEKQVLEFLQSVCSALTYLHEQGIVHRDLSPDNFIKASAEYKLIDFEVSRKTDAGVTATIVGKHAYISPEQFRGKTSQQSDIYSLGATLYFLLTARDPEPIDQSCLSEGDTGYGTILDKIIQKCTDLDLSNRFGSVSEIQDWLSNAEGTVINIKAEREVEEAKIWQS
jgi:hypothetical protein